MTLGFLFFIQNFLKHCKALSTVKYRRYINIYYYYYYYHYYCLISSVPSTPSHHSLKFPTPFIRLLSSMLRHVSHICYFLGFMVK